MNLLQNRNFKLKYQKCKCRVKMWESDFKKKYGHNPTKDDIRAAPCKVRESYKMYYDMKTKMLEELDILMNEETLPAFSENNSDAAVEDVTKTGENDCDVTKTEKNDVQRIALADIQNCPESTDANNSVPKKTIAKEETIEQKSVNQNSVWGAHLNMTKTTCEKKNEGFKRSYSSTFVEKLAKGAQFCKRKPRKSLSTRSSKNCKPGLFNTLSQDCFSENVSPASISFSQGSVSHSSISFSQDKSFSCSGASSSQNNSFSRSSISFSQDSSFSHTSMGFSQDTTMSCSSVEFSPDNTPVLGPLSCSLPLQSSQGENSVNSESSILGLQSLKLKSNKKSMNHQPVNIIHKAITSNNIHVKKRSVDTGWLERCTMSDKNVSCVNDNAVDTPWESVMGRVVESNSDDTGMSKSVECDDIGSDEDVIYSSDTECSQGIFTLKRKSSFLSFNSEIVENAPKRQKMMADNEDIFDSLPQNSSCNLLVAQPSASQESVGSGMSVADAHMPRNSSVGCYGNETQPLSEANIEELAEQVVENKVISGKVKKTPGQKLTKKELLEKKLASGQANENFVKINLKKKVYVRGKKTMTFSKNKKLQWKANKKSAALRDDTENASGVLKCFKCGDVGHFARNCLQNTGDKLMPLSEDEEDCVYPTLEEAAAMAASLKVPPPRRTFLQSQNASNEESTGVKIPDYVLESLKQQNEKKAVSPVYSLGSDGCPIAPPEEVFSALREFGFSQFREGQCEAIMRILSGLSTLVTLSTGSGKSLCYQLPALIYSRHSKCITLVVSPLVSLMEDQVAGLPKSIKIACLHHNQTDAQRTDVMERAKAGELDALLVSPEAVMSGGKSKNFGSIIHDLPPIAFACIDEAHCLSQWSHNFRPSYLMISETLRTKMGVQTFLGLTATATLSTCRSILHHLRIPDDGKGIIKDVPLPDNLILTVSRDRRRDDALLALLSGPRFSCCDSIIIYCTRRVECERLAGLIRTCLQEGRRPEEKKIRCQISTNAEAYHAGLTAGRRRMVQKYFMSGKLRIVVATVAFGMGIDKQDIRAVIHYNMPRNFESYVQEVGRAGRDGLPAHCHLFLDCDGGDLNELCRHIHANSVDRHVMRKLLQRVFIPCRCNRLKKLIENSYAENSDNGENENASVKCPGHEVAFKISEMVQVLDLPEENISTMLCYLELHSKQWIKVLPPTYTMCKVQSYRGPKALKLAANECPPLAMAIALDQKQGISHEKSNRIEFPVMDIAAALNWESSIVKSHLKKLEWNNLGGKWQRSRICVEFQDLGFRVQAPGMLPADELDEALDVLHERVDSQERSCLLQLQYAYDAFHSVAFSSCLECIDTAEEGRSNSLKKQIREYFQFEHLNAELKIKETLLHEEQVVADTRNLVCSYPDTTFTGRAVARVFHGIESPCFPAQVWGRCRFWRAHLNEDFKLLVKVATREILLLK